MHAFISSRSHLASCCLIIIAAATMRTEHLAHAQIATFQLDASQSYLRIVPTTWGGFPPEPVSGTMFSTLLGIAEQQPGSLRTSLSGQLVGSVNGNSLSILPGVTLVAGLHSQAPFLPSPAITGSPGGVDNFGAVGEYLPAVPLGNGHIALREAVATIVGGAVTIGDPAASLEYSVTSGILDFDLGYPVEPETGYVDLPLVLPTALNESPADVTGSLGSTIRIPFSLEFPFDLVEEPNDDSLLVMEGLIVATRVAASAPGDFTGDGSVNGLDLAEWKAAFGATAEADGDGDGDSDGRDFLIWQRALGTPPVAVVPEPASLALAVLALFSLRSRPVRLTHGL
jgi:hypothetical protein